MKTTSPGTSQNGQQVAYLVVGQGGLWGIDETYTPVPWSDFKSAVTTNLLILPVQKSTPDAAPHFSEDKIGRPGEFGPRARPLTPIGAPIPRSS
jgi:hypothetical protein